MNNNVRYERIKLNYSWDILLVFYVQCKWDPSNTAISDSQFWGKSIIIPKSDNGYTLSSL